MPRITFLHPDLGIGGAERLVVDAALALAKHNNSVKIVTTHHDPSRAFEETVNGEIDVCVVGNWIPRNIFNRFYALMAYIRMVYAAFYIILVDDFKPDVVFCDLVSVAVPILKLKVPNVIFYCHYPDQLLSQPQGFLKALYRAPIDWLEEVSTGRATQIFVNSKFTAQVFKKTFKRISRTPSVLYPSLNMPFFDSFGQFLPLNHFNKTLNSNVACFLSINRYERKKNLNLAIEAFYELQKLISQNEWNNVHLIIAGGYDTRVTENVEYFEELNEVAVDLKINDKITFLRSFNDSEKVSLLKMCTCLLYTPSNEHFGIVPIEAMYMGKPVIAANSGGPMETVVHEKTGFLCSPSPKSFAEAMSKFVVNKNLSESLGAAGKKRVSSLFSFDDFSRQLNGTINELLNKKKN